MDSYPPVKKRLRKERIAGWLTISIGYKLFSKNLFSLLFLIDLFTGGHFLSTFAFGTMNLTSLLFRDYDIT